MICAHFGACGGCASQDVAYPDQVAAKEAALTELFGRPVSVRPSPRPLHYRTRMDYVYAWGKLGLRKKGDPRGVLDLDECHLIEPRAFEAVQKAKESIKRHDIRSYSYISKKGYLRYVSVRSAPVNGELMLIFLTNGDAPDILPLLDEAGEWADSVVWSVTDRRADLSIGDVKEHRRRDWIEERIGPVMLRFGPNSFFQGNPWQTEAVYAHVAERVHGDVLDVCCGVGGFALSIAKRGVNVVGVDNNAEAIAFAEGNAERNGCADTRFVTADANAYLADHGADTLVLDPPRKGLGFSAVKKITSAAPERVLYVSCAPAMLALELQRFTNYEVAEIQGFDLFPQTPHVEVVATLLRR